MTEKVGDWSTFDRVSTIAAVLGGAGALAISASLTASDRLIPYVLIALVAALGAALVAFIARLATFGRCPPDVDRLLPARVRRAELYWLIIKVGIVFASIYLFIAAGVGAIIGRTVGFLIEAAVLLTLTMIIGNMMASCVINIALMRSRQGAGVKTETDI